MEYLNLTRAAEFITYVNRNDLQILSNRRVAMGLWNSVYANEGESDAVLAWPANSYETILSYLSQSDAQVHFPSGETANRNSNIGTYAFVKHMGNLRRAVRDCSNAPPVNGRVMASPSRPVAGPISSPLGGLQYVISADPATPGVVGSGVPRTISRPLGGASPLKVPEAGGIVSSSVPPTPSFTPQGAYEETKAIFESLDSRTPEGEGGPPASTPPPSGGFRSSGREAFGGGEYVP